MEINKGIINQIKKYHYVLFNNSNTKIIGSANNPKDAKKLAEMYIFEKGAMVDNAIVVKIIFKSINKKKKPIKIDMIYNYIICGSIVSNNYSKNKNKTVYITDVYLKDNNNKLSNKLIRNLCNLFAKDEVPDKSNIT